MLRNYDALLRVIESFQNAALDGTSWHAALRGLAHATGSRSGELIGLGSEATVPFNIVTDIDPSFVEDFVAVGGGDPRLNPRVRAGASTPVLTVLAESDFISEEEYRNHDHLQHLARRWDVAFSCLTALERSDGVLIGLAVMRSRREGHITDQQRELFAAVAPHVRAAVRTQIALEGNGAAVVTGAMEALTVAAFVCDRTGLVRHLTPAAETLIGSGPHLRLKLGRLSAVGPDDAKALSDAIDAAAVLHTRPERPALRTVIVRAPGGEPLALDVIALPSRYYELAFAPRVLIVARGAAGRDRRGAAILQAAYGLTPAETDIAQRLADGEAAEAIAATRRVSVGTIRTQIKSVLAKVGVKSQIELLSRLGRLRL